MTTPLNRKQLYDLVWKKPIMEVAKIYGLSGRGLAKICERSGIPVPPRGYWARARAGRKIIRPPLIVVDTNGPDDVLLIRRDASLSANADETGVLPEEIREAMERELLPKNRIEVLKNLSKPHPIIAKWIAEAESSSAYYRGSSGTQSKLRFTDLEHRRLRIINALLKALEARGFSVENERRLGTFIWIFHERDKIGFGVREYVRQIRRRLTEEEKKMRRHSEYEWTQYKEATGQLILRLSSQGKKRSYDAKDFMESADAPLEDQLNNVVAAVIEILWKFKKRRVADEAAQERRWEQEERQRQREKLLKVELERKAKLETKAADWKKAQSIREYITAVEQAYKHKRLPINANTFSDWKEWALAHAKALDPIDAGEPLT